VQVLLGCWLEGGDPLRQLGILISVHSSWARLYIGLFNLLGILGILGIVRILGILRIVR
jgi:hypothetical protein